jgi:hypothetical protein
MSIPAGVVNGLDSQRLGKLGIPADCTVGNHAAYLLAFVTDPETTVTEAAKRAGLTPSAVRQRRSRDPIFAAAETAVREGRKYVPPDAPPVDDEPGPPKQLTEWTPGLDEEALIKPERERSYRVIRTSRAPDWSR